MLSTKFNLSRGCRQGCSLSPLLFALAIEPLAESVRNHPGIFGYNTRDTRNKISLYADDVLIYITKLETSIPNLLNLITQFGQFSGYRINWNKSEIMPITKFNLHTIQQSPFKIVKDKFKYLGIYVTKTYISLFKLNFPPLLNKRHKNIQYWKTLPISMLGRINAIKMIFLPQLLYLLQLIPIYIPKTFFKKVDSIVTSFVWDYKNHRISKKHLCKSKINGGLALPNFLFYIWAVHIKNMNFWLEEMDQQPDWLMMEKEDCLPFEIGPIIFAPTKLHKKTYKENPIIHSGIRIWKQIKKDLKLNNIPLCLPIVNNPLFKSSFMDKGFTQWKNYGIKNIGHLYGKGTFLSFQELQQNYGLHSNNFFRYLQIRDYVKSNTQVYRSRESEILDECLNKHPNTEKLIAYIYNTLLNNEVPPSEPYRYKWENEIGHPITKDMWDESLQQIHQCSLNARHTLIQFKVLHRLHYSKLKLNRIFPQISPICDKCLHLEANLTHTFANCIKLKHFWTDIFEITSEVINTKLDPDTKLIILGISEQSLTLTTNQRNFLDYSIIIGKKLILKFWKGPTTPTIKM